MNKTPSIISAAMITVCVPASDAEQILKGTEGVPWIVTPVHFESYISSARRPYFGPQVRSSQLVLAVVDFSSDVDQAVEAVRYLQQLFVGKVTVIALAEVNDPDLLLLAMRVGCTEFLVKPLLPVNVSQTMSRLNASWLQSSVRTAPLGSLISLFGSKGGVGTTTLAVHLAVYLAQCHGKRTLLVDNHPELGHVCIYLGIDGSKAHFHEIVTNVARLDSDLLHTSVVKHSSGLDILSSPSACGGMKVMDGESIAKTLEFLRSEYDYVIADCTSAQDEVNLACIDASSKVYLVATPEVGAVRDLSLYVDNLMRIECTTEKMHVVINRFSSRYAVGIEQIEKAIHLPVAIKLPNCYTELVRSVNLGEPVSPTQASPFATQMTQWASTLVGSQPSRIQAKKEKSFFDFFKQASTVTKVSVERA